MGRLFKRLLIILLMVAVLVPSAVKPASAVAVEACLAVAVPVTAAAVTTALVAAKTQETIVETIIREVKDYIKTFVEKIKTVIEQKNAIAQMQNAGKLKSAETQARVAIEDLPSPKKNVCKRLTAEARLGEAIAVVDASVANKSGYSATKDFGGVPRRAADGRIITNPNKSSVVDAIAKADQVCDAESPDKRSEACKAMDKAATAAGKPPMKLYPNADIATSTLLGGEMFEDAKQAEWAGRLCDNITSNVLRDLLTGKAIVASPENLGRFMHDMSEISIMQQSRLLCDRAIEVRKSPNNPLFTPYRDGEPDKDSSDNRKTVYQNLRNLGWSPADAARAASTTSWDPTKMSLAQAHQFKRGLTPSLRLQELADIGGMANSKFMAGVVGGDATGLQNVITTQIFTLRQRWREYELLEKQTLTRALLLARMTREASGQL